MKKGKSRNKRKKNGRYYSFRCHYGNCYHGYWDNTMPEKNRRIADGIV